MELLREHPRLGFLQHTNYRGEDRIYNVDPETRVRISLDAFTWHRSSSGRTQGNKRFRHSPILGFIFRFNERGADQGYSDYQSKDAGSIPAGSNAVGL